MVNAAPSVQNSNKNLAKRAMRAHPLCVGAVRQSLGINRMTPREILQSLFEQAVRAADPLYCLKPALLAAGNSRKVADGKLVVLGVGKAAARMAQAVEQSVIDQPIEGLVVTRYGHGLATERIEVLEAGHPISDQNGVLAAHKMRACAQSVRRNDTVWVLLSGGGSALLAAPGGAISLADWNTLNQALLRSGAGIHDINLVRKHIGGLNGGRLARMFGQSRVHGFVLSDIPGDNVDMVASGPISPEGSSAQTALALLEHWQIAPPPAVYAHLIDAVDPPVSHDEWQTLNVQMYLIGSASQSLQAASQRAEELRLSTWVLSADIEGEASWVGQSLAMTVLRVFKGEAPVKPPCVILSGGETSVSVAKPGRGGRNAECLLSAAITLEKILSVSERSRVFGLFADTDGIDGTEDNAGAFMDGESMARLRALGLSPEQLLREHASYDAFAALNDLLMTGPTHTNVNDFRAWLII